MSSGDAWSRAFYEARELDNNLRCLGVSDEETSEEAINFARLCIRSAARAQKAVADAVRGMGWR